MVTASLPISSGQALVSEAATSWPLHLLLALLCLVVAGLAAHAGASLLLYSPTKIAKHPRLKNDDGSGAATLARLQACGTQYELVSWGLTLAGVATFFPLLAAASEGFLGWPLLAIGGLAVLFFCAALPLALAEAQAERWVLITLPALQALRGLLYYPVVLPAITVTRWTLRAMRIPATARTPEEIADEIMAAVTDSAAENALEGEERHWIENIVEMKDLRVSEAMTPRTDIIAFEASIDLREAVERAIQTGHSRYPVYEEKVDRIVGVFYAKDALARLSNGASKQVPVREVMRKPLFVPESMGVSELLKQFKATKLQMAIVLDEYGGTAGLISIEDILEEIIGDIADEFDADEEAALVVLTQNRVAELSGRVRVAEANEALGCEIPENPEYDTVAGYVFTNLGKIPKEGETVTIDGIEFCILESDDRRIGRLRMTVPEPQPTEPD